MKKEKAEGWEGKGKLMGNGKAKLLSDNAFVMMVIEHEETQRREAAEKEARKATRETCSQVVERWKAAEVERKKRNEEHTQWYRVAVVEWKRKHDEHKPMKPRYTKPKGKPLKSLFLSQRSHLLNRKLERRRVVVIMVIIWIRRLCEVPMM